MCSGSQHARGMGTPHTQLRSRVAHAVGCMAIGIAYGYGRIGGQVLCLYLEFHGAHGSSSTSCGVLSYLGIAAPNPS